MTEVADAFAWWEDKQVAVRVNGKVVRGWVRAARHTAAPDTTPRNIAVRTATARDTSPRDTIARNGALANRSVTDSFVGQMDIVLMLDSAAEAAMFPSEIHVGIEDDGRHGRPVGVARLWPEYGDDATVRARPAAGHLAVQRRLTQAAHRRTPVSR